MANIWRAAQPLPRDKLIPPHTHTPGDEMTASGARAAQSGLRGLGEGGLARGLRGRSAPPLTLFPALLLAVKGIGCVGVVEGGYLVLGNGLHVLANGLQDCKHSVIGLFLLWGG